METKTLIFRKAVASDLDAVTAIYDRLHAQEDAGRVTIGWVTGVYPIRFDAEQALARWHRGFARLGPRFQHDTPDHLDFQIGARHGQPILIDIQEYVGEDRQSRTAPEGA